MNLQTKILVLLVGLLSVAVLAVACGAGDENPQSTVVNSASEPSATPAEEISDPDTSTIVTNDTPVPGSTDGTFVVGAGSEVTFTVNEKLSRLPLPNDAVLRTDDITGEIDFSAETASLVINLHSLASDESRRDDYVRDRLFPNQPTATISVIDFPDIPEIFADGESFTSSVTGTVNVNGIDADIEFELESRLDPDRLLVLVKGDFT